MVVAGEGEGERKEEGDNVREGQMRWEVVSLGCSESQVAVCMRSSRRDVVVDAAYQTS